MALGVERPVEPTDVAAECMTERELRAELPVAREVAAVECRVECNMARPRRAERQHRPVRNRRAGLRQVITATTDSRSR